MLGYRDSGMKDTEANANPGNFQNAPLDEAVERLVRIIRAEHPQVIITYGDDQKFYPHPDHVRVHEISGPAFDAAGDPDRFPDAGDPWQPSKLYYTGWSARRVRALHEEFLAHGTQVDPTGFWMRLPDDVVRRVFPWEEFALARTLVDTGVPEGEPEDDLFAGLRVGARR